MDCYFSIENGEQIPLIGPVSYSTGDALETTQKFGYDYSKQPQTLIYRKRKTALQVTLQMAFTPAMVFEAALQPMDYVATLENLCGKKGVLVWEGEAVGSFVIQSVSFSAECDVYQLFGSMSVTLSMTEGYVKVENLAETVEKTPVSTL